MKKYLIIAATALSLAACSNDKEYRIEKAPVAAKVTASIEGVSTRASNSSWDQGDAIGISCSSATTNYKNMKYVTALGDGNFEHADGEPMGIFFQTANETVNFSAYYPFAGTNGTEAGVISNVTTDDQTKQKQFDFLFADNVTASRESYVVRFTGEHPFNHKMCRLIINLSTSADADFKAEDVFAGSYSISGIKHSGSFNTATGEATATGDASANWDITAVPTDDAANATRTYSMIFYPQGENATITFYATIAGQVYTCQINPNLTAGKSNNYTIITRKTGLKVSSCSINNWEDANTGNIEAQ